MPLDQRQAVPAIKEGAPGACGTPATRPRQPGPCHLRDPKTSPIGGLPGSPDLNPHRHESSRLVSFGHVRRRSVHTMRDRRPRSRTLSTVAGPSRADLESVLGR
jgi:hypothetical protein